MSQEKKKQQVASSAQTVTLKMEAACYPEVAGCPQTTQGYNPKNHTLIGHCHENLKSSLALPVFNSLILRESVILAELRGCI
jgi:hypothetical protein